MNRKPIHALILGTASLLAALAAGSCTEEYTPDNKTDDGRIEVRIAAPTTRTSIADDGMNGRWTKGDKIALWALSGQTTVLSAETFSLWHSKPDLSDACFTARIAPMQTGTYDYYAVSPAPAAASGTTVSYDIPSVQDGSWNGALDIMHAAAQGSQLTAGLNELVLSFRHKVHALRITVPEGRNRFGSTISKLIIDFPQAVAGRMTFDAATADAEATLDAATNSITIDFPTPIDEGDSFWVFIAPADLSDGEVRFTAFSGDECSTPIGGRFGECAAGRITPVDLTIRESRGKVTWFDCTMDCSQLGEPVDLLTLTLPDGRTFATGAESCSLTPDAEGIFSFALLSDDVPALAGAALKSVYESESAIVEDRVSPVTIPTDYTLHVRNRLADKAPYLLYEDFSTIGEYHTANEDGGVKETQGSILTDWGLDGWNAARGGTVANTCIMANCYIATHSGITDSRVKGRIDTCPLPLKAGKKVNVKVSFDTGFTKKAWSGGSDQANSYATCTFGRTDVAYADTPLASDQPLTAVTMSEQKVSQLSDTSNLPDKWYEQAVNDCTSSSRLTWQIYSNRTSIWATTKMSFYCHIDNIRVTIVK